LIVKTYFLDPSKGRQDKPGDYQAHVWGGWSRKENALFVECDLRREPGPEMVARAIGHAVGFGCTEVTIEGNSDGVGLLYTEFQRALERRGAVVGLNTIHHTDPKLSRIRGLGPLLARGQIRIRNTPGGKMAVDQLRDVPSGEHDDAPDSMSGLHRTIMAKLKGR
jgi:predicted phage terminase large subunit-like protein